MQEVRQVGRQTNKRPITIVFLKIKIKRIAENNKETKQNKLVFSGTLALLFSFCCCVFISLSFICLAPYPAHHPSSSGVGPPSRPLGALLALMKGLRRRAVLALGEAAKETRRMFPGMRVLAAKWTDLLA